MEFRTGNRPPAASFNAAITATTGTEPSAPTAVASEDAPLSIAIHVHNQAGCALHPLALTPSAVKPNSFSRVPIEVVELVSEFVGYPHQVSMAAASKVTHQTINNMLAYTQVHAVVRGEMSEVRELRKQILAGYRKLIELRDSFAPRSESWLPVMPTLASTIAQQPMVKNIQQLSDRQMESLSRLSENLATLLSDHVLANAPAPTRAFWHACDRFFEARDYASAKAVFDAEIAGDRQGFAVGDPSHGIKQFLKPETLERIRAGLRDSIIQNKSQIAREMSRDWPMQLAQLFATANATGASPARGN